MLLTDYVENSFGQDYSEKLAHIRTGGDNNQKGGVFETYFIAAKICDIAANNQNSLSEIIISYQEEWTSHDFIDTQLPR